MAPTAAAPVLTAGFHQIDTDAIESSGLNPRTHWNDADDQELQASIRAEGVLEPILVRPHPTKLERFQVVAGERRFRASKAVGLGQIPAIVRDVTDEKLVELALAENIQRRNMHPLDEANGFIRRLEMGGCSPEALAASLGLSKRYVTDRIRLKKLSAKAAKMLEAGDMTVSHAIILAKLDPKQQDRAIEDCTDYAFGYDDKGNREVLEPVESLKRWIFENIRLDPTSPEAQEEFPQLVEASTEAAAKGATVVMLSGHRTPYQHKAKPGDPLFADKWEKCKKTDKAAQIGVIVEGPGQGERVYFKPAAPPKRESSSRAGGPQGGAVKETAEEKSARQKREAAAEQRQREEAALWNKHKKDALQAYVDYVGNLPVKALIALAAKKLGGEKTATAEAFLVAAITNRAKNSTYNVDGFEWAVKDSGFNVKQWLKTQAALTAERALQGGKLVQKMRVKAAKKAKKR